MDAEKSLLVLPTPDELNEIYRELGTSADKIDADAKTVAEWMRKQPHLPDPEGTEDDRGPSHAPRLYGVTSRVVPRDPRPARRPTRFRCGT